jgi:hypothetical protein
MCAHAPSFLPRFADATPLHKRLKNEWRRKRTKNFENISTKNKYKQEKIEHNFLKNKQNQNRKCFYKQKNQNKKSFGETFSNKISKKSLRKSYGKVIHQTLKKVFEKQK